MLFITEHQIQSSGYVNNKLHLRGKVIPAIRKRLENTAQVTPTSPELTTVTQKLARGSDLGNYTAKQITQEKRTAIEDLIRKQIPLARIAYDTSSSKSTVQIVRDQLLEREPALFRGHMAANLQRIANKAASTIEQGLDALEGADVKPSMIAGISVALGIILDKQSVMLGETTVQVVEHRLKVDADAISRMISVKPLQPTIDQEDIIDVA